MIIQTPATRHDTSRRQLERAARAFLSGTLPLEKGYLAERAAIAAIQKARREEDAPPVAESEMRDILAIEGSKYFRDFCPKCGEPMRVQWESVGRYTTCSDCTHHLPQPALLREDISVAISKIEATDEENGAYYQGE